MGVVASDPLRRAFKIATAAKELCRLGLGVEYALDRLFNHAPEDKLQAPFCSRVSVSHVMFFCVV